MLAEPHLSNVESIVLGKERRSQLSGRHHTAALRQRTEHRVKVGLLHHLQVLVGRRSRGAAYTQAGVEDGNALFAHHRLDGVKTVSLMRLVDEVQLVAKEDQPHDAPHVVGVVGVIPLHAPTLRCRRKGAEHQQLGIRRQEWRKGMRLHRLLRHFASLSLAI